MKNDIGATRLAKLRRPRRSAVKVSEQSLTRTRLLSPEQPLPLLVEPAEPGVRLNLERWVGGSREWIESELKTRGGLLFRGFEIGSVAAFQRAAAALSSELLDYNEPSTARSKVEGKVYTSTEYSADQTIPMHNELSYSTSWPRKIWFYCVEPAAGGGRTPIADSRRVYQAIASELRDRFLQRGVMYVRKYGYGVGRSWNEVFATERKADVEEHCAERGIDYEWRGSNRLITRQVRPADAVHPLSGEPLWFNQAHLHHITSLPGAIQESIRKVSDDPSLPLDINSFYGDGSEIDPEDLDAIRRAFDQSTVSFPWQKGDVMLLDNMLIAHGREPFQGSRKVVVAMAEPYSPNG